MAFIVAIDGGAGSGKSTVAKLLAKEFNLLCIDTGALYRMITLKCLNDKININDEKEVIRIAKKTKLEIKHHDNEQIFLLDNKEVNKEIRGEKVSNTVARIAKIPEVRKIILTYQRYLALHYDIIMEGRDITTVVFPNADVKIYLDANIQERAKRRFLENKERGIMTSYEETLKELQKRDNEDKKREVSSLKIAHDATVIDTTNMSINDVKRKIASIIKEKRNL